MPLYFPCICDLQHGSQQRYNTCHATARMQKCLRPLVAEEYMTSYVDRRPLLFSSGKHMQRLWEYHVLTFTPGSSKVCNMVSFVCSGGVATSWPNGIPFFLPSAIPVCCQCHAITRPSIRKHSVLGVSKGHLVKPNGYISCAGAGPPHLDAGTEDPLLTLQYEQAGLLDKSHNADQRHGPSDTCPCVIATRVLLELDWLWM